jgi:glycosyltransferase involved in cell wall biosynthesis
VSIQVIIPAVERCTVRRVIDSLIAADRDIAKIYVVGPRNDGIVALLTEYGYICSHIAFDVGGSFCKSALLNAGLKAADGENILVSDADIVWNKPALTAMLATIDSRGGFCHVSQVDESRPHFSNPVWRLKPTIDFRERIEVSIVRDPVYEGDRRRPGPGLILGRRLAWFDVGGFNEELVGWGWEDHDFLVRAQIMGYTVSTAGQVLHLSHADHLRNRLNGGIPKNVTRDANIAKSLEMIEAGILTGPLTSVTHSSLKILIRKSTS